LSYLKVPLDLLGVLLKKSELKLFKLILSKKLSRKLDLLLLSRDRLEAGVVGKGKGKFELEVLKESIVEVSINLLEYVKVY